MTHHYVFQFVDITSIHQWALPQASTRAPSDPAMGIKNSWFITGPKMHIIGFYLEFSSFVLFFFFLFCISRKDKKCKLYMVGNGRLLGIIACVNCIALSLVLEICAHINIYKCIIRKHRIIKHEMRQKCKNLVLFCFW